MSRRPYGYEMATVNCIDERTLTALREVQHNQAWPLMMAGPTGCGKTCAAAVLYGTFHELPMWHRADDLLLSMSTGRVSGVEVDALNEYYERVRRTLPFAKFVDRVTHCSCLFLDDVGLRKPTDGMYQAFFDLLEWRRKGPVVITTNATMEQLSNMYDDRIVSRLAAGTVIRFAGTDRRTHRRPVNAGNVNN